METGFVEQPARGGVPGAHLRYRKAGSADAPAVTLLHSLATHGDVWAAEAAALVDAGYQVVVPDMRGHGASVGGGDDFTLALLAQDVVAIWDALGIARSSVVGLSIGGMIALHLALDHPERVGAAIAADCRSDAPPFFVSMWDARRALLAESGMGAVADATLPTWLTPQCDAAMVAKVRQLILDTSIDGYNGATRALQRLALFDRLGEISRPVRFIVGAADGVHPEAMRAMAARTPAADLIEIADAAHLANIEQPQAFSDAVLSFMNAERERGAI